MSPTPEATAETGASVGDLIGNVTRDLSTLMRQELALAQAELKQEAATTGKAAGALGGAGFAGYFVVLFLSIVLWAVIAAVLFVTGRERLRRVHPRSPNAPSTPSATFPTPSRAPEEARRDHPERSRTAPP